MNIVLPNVNSSTVNDVCVLPNYVSITSGNRPIIPSTEPMSNNDHMGNYSQNISHANIDGLHGVTSGDIMSKNLIPISHSNIMPMSDNVYVTGFVQKSNCQKV